MPTSCRKPRYAAFEVFGLGFALTLGFGLGFTFGFGFALTLGLAVVLLLSARFPVAIQETEKDVPSAERSDGVAAEALDPPPRLIEVKLQVGSEIVPV